jgi:hypothetical protein
VARKARVLKEKLTQKQTDRIHDLGQRLVTEFSGYGPADVDALIAAADVVYDIEKIIYSQPKRR